MHPDPGQADRIRADQVSQSGYPAVFNNSKISDRQDEEIISSNYLFQDSSPDSRRSLMFKRWCFLHLKKF